MIEERTRMLIATVHKLMTRGARPNIVRILKKTHAADLALLLQYLVPEERIEIFQMVEPIEQRAEVLSHMESEFQEEFVQILSKEELLRLVALMDTDDAADLLGALPEEESKEILSQMVKEDSQEVADLMGYPEDSAGGLMSSEYISFNQSLSVQQAIETIQKQGDAGHVTFYLYVVNDNRQLVGVVSLKQLLLSKRQDLLKVIMFTDVISVRVDTDQDDVANIVEKYDFLALPVVDGNNELVGVITVDDVIDVIRESAEEDLLAMGRAGWGVSVSFLDHLKARLPWVCLAFLGGSLCFSLVYLFGRSSNTGSELGSLWLITAFIPLILSLGATTGSQAATVVVGAIRSGRFDMGKARAQIFKEFKLAGVIGLTVGLVVFGLTEALFSPYQLSLVFSVAVLTQIVLSVSVGSLIPILLYRAGVDPTAVSVPLFTILADFAAIGVLFGYVRLL